MYHHHQCHINHFRQIFGLAHPHSTHTHKYAYHRKVAHAGNAPHAPIRTAIINECLFLIITILCYWGTACGWLNYHSGSDAGRSDQIFIYWLGLGHTLQVLLRCFPAIFFKPSSWPDVCTQIYSEFTPWVCVRFCIPVFILYIYFVNHNVQNVK